MKACGVKGSIVNLSTNGSKHVPPFPAAVYCSVKAAIDHLTHCMAVELAPHNVCSTSGLTSYNILYYTTLYIVRVLYKVHYNTIASSQSAINTT